MEVYTMDYGIFYDVYAIDPFMNIYTAGQTPMMVVGWEH